MKIFIFLLSGILALNKLPIRIFHSYSGYCQKMKFKGRAVCVETATAMDTVLKSLDVQAQIGCEKLKQEQEELKNGFYVVGYSQGGLIARTIFQKCFPINKLIKRIVFISTPHLGASEVPMFPGLKVFLSPSLNLDKVDNVLLKKLFPKLTDEQASKLASKSHEAATKEKILKIRTLLQYLKSDKRAPDADKWVYTTAPANYFLGHGPQPFINDLNSVKYDPLFGRLDVLVNIVSKNDTVIVPPNSNTFGADIKAGVIADASSLPYYTQHHKGVGHLYKKGKMFNCVSDSVHGMTKNEEMRLIFEVLLDDDVNANNHKVSAENQLKTFVANYPNKCTGVAN